MPWTESGSREEWLDRVTRRGERIRRRRRRRLLAAAAGVLALAAPVGAFSTMVAGRSDRVVNLAVAGPAAATSEAPPARAGDGNVDPVIPPGAGSSGEQPPLSTTTTTAEVHERVASVNGPAPVRPAPTTTTPPAEDPVVRPTTSVPGQGTSTSAGSGSSPPLTPSTTVAPLGGPPPACAASEVMVTVSTEKAAYRAGEPVRSTSTLENRGTTTCLLPTRAFFRIEDGAGRTVGSFAYTADYRLPVAAEPGKTFTSGVTWDQRDCSGPACAQALAGAYVAVADWTEGGPYSGRATFHINA